VNYSIIILPSAEKQILRLNSPEYEAVRAGISDLGENPRPVRCRKTVTVLKVAHRKDVYR
jgi:mRNA-degrading endonuclease RelE of RelBE toxin-antitoxin system